LKIFILLIFSLCTAHRVIPAKNLNNITLAFGSCNPFRGTEPSDIFYRIAELNPDVWIWLGDAYYADRSPTTLSFNGEEIVKKKIANVKAKQAYITLREKTPIIGVWDDHDYGKNNANKHFPYKKLTQQLFLDFLDEPENSNRRLQEGIYESYYIGDETRIKVILVDVWYFRDPMPFFDNGKEETGDTLGEIQWKWLEEEIANSQSEYMILGSGSIVLPDDRIFPETWHATSRKRLISILRKYKKDKFLILSEDIHYAEIDTYPCPEEVGFRLYEITSSGLTHSVNMLPAFGEFITNLFPQTFNGPEDRYTDLNFGALNFDFENNKVTIQIRNYTGQVVIEKIFAKQIWN